MGNRHPNENKASDKGGGRKRSEVQSDDSDEVSEGSEILSESSSYDAAHPRRSARNTTRLSYAPLINCEYCGVQFKTEEECLLHKQKSHIKELTITEEYAEERRRGIRRRTQYDPESPEKGSLTHMCSRCQFPFSTETIKLYHEQQFCPYRSDSSNEDENESVDDDEKEYSNDTDTARAATHFINTTSDAPTSTRLANIILAVPCPYCDETFATIVAMKHHKNQVHKETEEDEKRYMAVEQIPDNKDQAAAPLGYLCCECGALFKTEIELVQHEDNGTCLKTKYDISEAAEHFEMGNSSNNVDVRGNDISFGPPAAKRLLLSQPVSRDPVATESTEQIIVTTSAPPKPARAKTQDVLRNLPSFLAPKHPILIQPYQQNASIAPLNQSAANLPTSMQDASSTPLIVPSSVGERIQKNPLPLSTAIITRSLQDPNELLVAWSQSLEDDLIQAVKLNPAHVILCVKELDTENPTTNQKELFNKSHRVTFAIVDEKDIYSNWTVIALNEGLLPVSLNKKMFRRIVDVEQVFSDHAEANGKILHNIMRCDDLFPLLSSVLEKRITGFNSPC